MKSRASVSQVPRLTFDDLLARFLDAQDWNAAHQKFPKTPWKFYCKPHGQYPNRGWSYFKKAYLRAWTKANRPAASLHERIINNRLSLDFIIELNSLMLFGESRPAEEVIRNYIPVHRQLLSSKMKHLFVGNGTQYKNADRLNLRVEGFLPFEESQLVNLAFSRSLDSSKDLKQIKLRVKGLRREIQKRFPEQEKKNVVYFLLSPHQIQRQLKSILNFYNKECRRILRDIPSDSPHFYSTVAVLALKMQRYLDMTHLAIDATSRTTRLVEEYIYWQFGFPSPDPKPILLYKNKWHRLAYLPFELAKKKVKSKSKTGHYISF